MTSEKKPLLSHLAPIILVEDMEESIQWYNDLLGFKTLFTWEEPPTYAVLGRDSIRIHLSLKDDNFQPSKVHTHLYIFVYDVDELHAELKEKNLEVGPINSYEYGMRDFDLTDLNGNKLCFGMENK